VSSVDIAPTAWPGRDDGPGPQHLRWHSTIVLEAENGPGTTAFVGFRSDEGVRRNQGRPGAAEGPTALRWVRWR
jgi:formiminoglutamase